LVRKQLRAIDCTAGIGQLARIVACSLNLTSRYSKCDWEPARRHRLTFGFG
jgi:hypothetical protein